MPKEQTIKFKSISDLPDQLNEEQQKLLLELLKKRKRESVLYEFENDSDTASNPSSSDKLEISGISQSIRVTIGKEQLTHFLNVTMKDGHPHIEYDKNKRPPTTLGKEGQGDHTIAYDVIFEIICSAIDGEEIEEIPNILVNIAKCFMTEADYEKLDNLKAKHENIIYQNTIERDKRKKFTAGIRTLSSKEVSNFLSKEKTPNKIRQACAAIKSVGDEAIKQNLKNNENNLILDATREIAETMMTLHQLEPLVAISKRRKSVKEKVLGQSSNKSVKDAEGARVKEGIRDLKIVNTFLLFREEFSNTKSHL